MADNLKNLIDLTPEQRSALMILLRQKAEGKKDRNPNEKPIEKISRSGDLPLSYAQQRMWFMAKLSPNSPAYNLLTAYHLKGPVIPGVLYKAINEVARRHESLRACFPENDGRPFQLILDPLTIPLPVIDLAELSEAVRLQEAKRLATEEQGYPFDLEQGPLFRPRLIRLGENHHVITITLHHVISDGVSRGILISELGALYKAFAEGKPSPLPDLEIQYVDFADWQRRWLQSDVLEQQLDYWKGKLDGAPAVLTLPTDRPRSATQDFQGRAVGVTVPTSTVEALKLISHKHRATLFMTFLAAFKTLLHHYTSQDGIVVGTPIAGRNRAEIEGLIGCFTNTLVLFSDLSGNPTFSELLTRVRETSLDAYANQDMPFDKLVEVIRPERKLSHNSLFQVLFALHNLQPGTVNLPEIAISPLTTDSFTSRLDLTVEVQEGPRGAFIRFEYSTQLFDHNTIVRMAGHFETLLQSIIREPDQRILDLAILTPGERALLLDDWNDTRVELSDRKSVHKMFEDQVSKSPEAVAVICHDREVTFSELNGRANQLAHHLKKRGVVPDTLVGICMERGVDMIVGLLATLKAGAAYLPLDPDYPSARLKFMLEDSKASIVLVGRELLANLADTKAEKICLEMDWDAIASEEATNPDLNVEPENLAYVIYTSGSTGTPKGVMIPHSGLTNYLRWCLEKYDVKEGTGAPTHSSLSFDLTITSLFPPLLAGRSVVLLPQDGGIEELADVLSSRSPFSLVKITPAHLEALSHILSPEDAALSTKVLVVGGEPLRFDQLEFWRANAPGTRIINEYGPTETVVGCSVYEVRCEDNGTGAVSIGSPIFNTKLYILGKGFQPVPMGVPGELYIGGDGVARGYKGRGDLTAERFLPDPFSAISGARLYRTGDLARYLPSGQIDFLGRLDHQVKIRGFRIELQEVEAALLAHPLISDAAVISVKTDYLNNRLAAFFVAADAALAAAELRGFLSERLPQYMIPASFSELDQLPLTPNGKLDRARLAALVSEPEPGAIFTPARSEAELLLAGIWQEALHLERVGISDNFFALGGDSIISIQIVARARRAGLVLTPRQMFQHQTIAELARVAGRTGQTPPRYQPAAPVAGEAALTPIQEWFFEQEIEQRSHFNQSVMLRLEREVDAQVMKQVVDQLVAHHDALRLSFRREGQSWRQRISGVQELPAAMAYIDLESVERGQREAVREAGDALQQSLDLERGPVLRVGLIRLGAGSYRLLLVIHHLAVDAVSWRILLEDLERWYEQLSQGEPAEVWEKTSSYLQWAERLDELARSAAVAQEVDYWEREIGTRGGEIVPDFDLGPVLETATDEVTVRLARERTRELLREAGATYQTRVEELLVSALVVALKRWRGQSEVVLELEGHGRDEEEVAGVDVTRTVGWFTRLHPVRLEMAGGPEREQEQELGELIKGVKEKLREAARHGLSFGLLRYKSPESTVRERMKHVDRAEVQFNYLGQLDRAVKQGSRLELAGERSGRARTGSWRKRYVLEINSVVSGGRLELSLSYSRNKHHRASIEELGQRYLEALEELVSHCLQARGGHTPSDFELAELSQAEIDELEREEPLEQVWELTPMQQGMLYHSLKEEGSGVYHNQVSWRLEGVEVEALKEAWREVIGRHSILRSSVQWEREGAPLAVVRKGAEVEWEEEDRRGLSAEEQQERQAEYLRKDRERGVDLRRGPLMRMGLGRVGERAYDYTWSNHHLILDGWSSALLIREVMRRYRELASGARRGERSGAEGVARGYEEYVRWLRRQDLEQAERYWRAALSGVKGRTRLSVERSGGEEKKGPGQKRELYEELSEEETERVKEGAREARVTVNTILAGAWAVLLARYSQEEEVVYGVTVAGRPAELEGAERMVGPFINTLVVRTKVEWDKNVGEWLAEQQQQQAELREYEYSPLMKVQRWSEVGSGEALFDTLLVYENYPVEEAVKEEGATSGAGVRGAGVRVKEVRISETTNYGVTVIVGPGNRMSLRVSYDESRYETEALQRLIRQLKLVLLELAQSRTSKLKQVRMLSEAERRQIVYEWNETQREYETDKSLVEKFEEVARRWPENIAVASGGEELSYQELNQRANQLGRYLRRRGVRAERAVGIMMERELEMVVGLVGILKAGGAYVPLDPEYPQQRVQYMVADAGAEVVLTDRKSRELIGELAAEIVEIEEKKGEIGRESGENLGREVGGGNLAYIIYTSGSTGQPKGAMNTHAAIYNRLSWMQDAYRLTAADRVLQKTPFSFDVSVWEFFWPLMTGARLVLARPGGHRDSAYLVQLIKQEQITTLHFVPAMLQVFLAERDVETCASLRRVICSGEALSRELHDRFFTRLSRVELYNLYGPTEAAVDVTAWACEPAGSHASVPIGRPIANTQIYIVDKFNQPVAIGVAGELLIGGAGVGRGYLSRPELTAEKFIPDCFSVQAGARLYRTGDLARHLADGNIEFLGRMDHQVKIRGFRIELQEIEAALLAHPDINDAAVISLKTDYLNNRLAAFFVAPDGSLSAADLRGFLSERLPDYMIPSSFSLLDQLPVTPNGKLDRSRLAALASESSSIFTPGKSESQSPRNDVEEVLALIWADVFGRDQVGVHDSFFELGGYSLLAILITARVREAFRIDLSLRSIFDAPTVAALARVIVEKQRGSATSQPAAIKSVPRVGPMPLSFEQDHLWKIEQADPGREFYIISTALMLAAVDVALLKVALREVFKRHESLRTRFDVIDGNPAQIISDSTEFDLHLVDLSHLPEESQEAETLRLALEDATRPFDTRGRLFRATLLQNKEFHVALLAMHMLICDGFSMNLLLRELTATYEALENGRPAPVTDLTVQYADYTSWQREYLQNGLLESEIGFWKERLGGAHSLSLPYDLPRSAQTSYQGESMPLVFSKELTDGLKALARREGASLYMVLMAALHVLLYRLTGETDTIIGAPGGARVRPEYEDIVGLFGHTLPIRADLSGEPSFRRLLKQIRELVLEAHAHQEVPMGKVVAELFPERSLSHSPLFQVALVVGAGDPTGKHLVSRRDILNVDTGVAKYDLTIQLRDLGNGLIGKAVYRADLYKAATISHLLESFEAALQAINKNPEVKITNLSLPRVVS